MRNHWGIRVIPLDVFQPRPRIDVRDRRPNDSWRYRTHSRGKRNSKSRAMPHPRHRLRRCPVRSGQSRRRAGGGRSVCASSLGRRALRQDTARRRQCDQGARRSPATLALRRADTPDSVARDRICRTQRGRPARVTRRPRHSRYRRDATMSELGGDSSCTAHARPRWSAQMAADRAGGAEPRSFYKGWRSTAQWRSRSGPHTWYRAALRVEKPRTGCSLGTRC